MELVKRRTIKRTVLAEEVTLLKKINELEAQISILEEQAKSQNIQSKHYGKICKILAGLRDGFLLATIVSAVALPLGQQYGLLPISEQAVSISAIASTLVFGSAAVGFGISEAEPAHYGKNSTSEYNETTKKINALMLEKETYTEELEKLRT